jgi:hypothetical protein
MSPYRRPRLLVLLLTTAVVLGLVIGAISVATAQAG